MNIKSIIAGFAAAVGLIAASASADTITQTKSFSGYPDYTSVLTFNQFDSSLGTLESITLDISLTAIGGALRVDNDSLTLASGAITFGATVDLSSSVRLIDTKLNPIVGPGDVSATGGTIVSVSADDSDIEVGGVTNFSNEGTDAAAYVGGTVNASDSGEISPLVHDDYIGTGTYTITVHGDQVADYGSLGGVQAQIDPINTNGTVTVTYNYTAIPEPSTVALLVMAGVAGFVGLRRKK